MRLTLCRRCQKTAFCSKQCKVNGWNNFHRHECRSSAMLNDPSNRLITRTKSFITKGKVSARGIESRQFFSTSSGCSAVGSKLLPRRVSLVEDLNDDEQSRSFASFTSGLRGETSPREAIKEAQQTSRSDASGTGRCSSLVESHVQRPGELQLQLTGHLFVYYVSVSSPSMPYRFHHCSLPSKKIQ